MTVVTTRSRIETVELGQTFAANLTPGDVVALLGDLGSGKTQFVTGICEGLQVSGHVASPTFTMIHEYAAPWGTVAHVDLYRIRSRAEIAELGIEEYFNDRCVCLIEWADAALDLLPQHYYIVRMECGADENERRITIHESQEAPA